LIIETSQFILISALYFRGLLSAEIDLLAIMLWIMSLQFFLTSKIAITLKSFSILCKAERVYILEKHLTSIRDLPLLTFGVPIGQKALKSEGKKGVSP